MVINLDYLTIRAFIEENKPFFSGARIQKIRQSSPRDLILVLRNNGVGRKLYISIDPELYYICFMSDETEKRRGLVYPKNPPMFCMLLRKYLDNAKIINISQPHYERIIEFEIETRNDFELDKRYILAVELMGKNSNVILYDKKSSIITGCAHNVGENKSTIRELYGGLLYVYPPSAAKKDFLRYFGSINYDTLTDEFLGFSKSFAELCNGIEGEKIKDMLELKNVHPALANNEYSIFGELLRGEKEFKSSVNEMIDEYYSKMQLNKKIATFRSKLLSFVLPKYKKLTTSLSKIKEVKSKRDNTDKYKLYGELLTAYAYLNTNFVSEITLKDYTTNNDVNIPLDCNLNMIENAKRYFKLYAKSKRTKEKTSELLVSLNTEKEYLENVVYSIKKADTLLILEEIAEEILPKSNVKNKMTNEPEKVIIEDYIVFVGRNNRQNDYIVSKLAKEDDIWFHVKDRAGSHVLLKMVGNAQPDDNIIFECCKLAKKYSSVPENEKNGVIYTKRKYIRKPPGANPGYVTYKEEKELYI